MPGPYEKFETAFEVFREEIKTELQAFKQGLLVDIRKANGAEPFDEDGFRKELIKDVHKIVWEAIDEHTEMTTINLKEATDTLFEQISGMIRRVAIELYESLRDADYQSRMIETWRDTHEEHPDESDTPFQF